MEQEKTYQSYWKIFLMISTYNISSFYFGYTFVYFNAVPYTKIHQIFHITFSKQVGEGILTGCIPIGATFGGYLIEALLGLVSRKQTIFCLNLIIFISGILVLIPNQYTLLFGRLLQGICIGAFCGNLPIIIKQISPVEILGSLGASRNIFGAVGNLIGFSIPYILSKNFQYKQFWMITFSLTLLTTMIQQILLLTIYTNQTPKYLLVNGRNQEAKQLISWIYLPEFHDQIYHEKLRDLEADNEQLEYNVKQYPQDNWKAIFIVIFLSIFHQLSGINIILLYGIQLAGQFMPGLTHEFSIMLIAFKTLVALLSVILMQRVGRRPLFIVGMVLATISLFGYYSALTFKNYWEGAYFFIIVGSTLVYAFSFTTTFGSLMWLYFSQIIQPNRIAYGTFTNWLATIFLVVLFPIIRPLCSDPNCSIMFLIYSICMAISGIVCYLFLVQTKDRTQLEIREDFNEKKIC